MFFESYAKHLKIAQAELGGGGARLRRSPGVDVPPRLAGMAGNKSSHMSNRPSRSEGANELTDRKRLSHGGHLLRRSDGPARGPLGWQHNLAETEPVRDGGEFLGDRVHRVGGGVRHEVRGMAQEPAGNGSLFNKVKPAIVGASPSSFSQLLTTK